MTIKKTLAPALIASIAVGIILFGFVSSVGANPSAYATTVQTASATTTISLMTAGTATTTLVYDSYATRSTAADEVGLQVQFVASSTASILNINYEYTNGAPGLDCLGTPSSCDWYQDNTTLNVTATTSQAYQVKLPNSYSWTFASSSQALAAVATNNNRALKMFNVPVKARYVRAIFSLPVGSTNAGVWAQFVPAKENN